MSIHIHFSAAAAQAFTAMPALATEYLNNTNRRVRVNLTGRTRGRMWAGGGTDGTSTSELRLQYSLNDGSSWDYLDGISGPSVSIAQLNELTQIGTWFDIVEAAQTEVLIRAVGFGGDGATGPTLAHIGAEFAAETPLYPRGSLAAVTTGRHYVAFGGSQIAGANHGSFGTTSLTLPAGVKYIRDGITLSSLGEPGGNAYPAEHGIEAGLLAALQTAGKISGTTFLGRYISASPVEDWVDTHFATVAADVVAAGITPNCAFFFIPGQNSTTAAQVARLIEHLPILQGMVNAEWPGCGLICFGMVAEDPSFLTANEARTVGRRHFLDPIDGLRNFIEHDEETISLQPEDNTHPNAAGEEQMGRLFAQRLLLYNIPG